MIQLSELLAPRPEQSWQLVKQCGVTDVVALLRGAEQEQRMFAHIGAGKLLVDLDEGRVPWSRESIQRDVNTFAEHGFRVVAIEDTPPMDKIRLGLPGRDEQVDAVITQLKAMGDLEIPVLCYNWGALSGWARTTAEARGRAGSLVTAFSAAEAAKLPPLVEPGSVSDEQLWAGLEYFLAAVLPVAEQVGVRLALHPDDPPVTQVRNMPKIMRSPDAYRRLLSMSSSGSNAITFCQGNFALMGADLPSLIREFGGQDKIAFVHFRDVRGTPEAFVETFHDEGQTDLAACMRAYSEIGFSGPMRPDHVPSMAGETNERPGYGTLGRLFAIGYIRGLEQATYGRREQAADHQEAS